MGSHVAWNGEVLVLSNDSNGVSIVPLIVLPEYRPICGLGLFLDNYK